LIFIWYTRGVEGGQPLSLMSTAARLTDMEISSPRQDLKKRVYKPTAWVHTTVNHILANETYCGKWHYLKVEKRTHRRRDTSEQIPIDVPAIIDRATWERAQARKAYNAKMAKRNSRRNYLLRGRVICKCGRAMHGYNAHTSADGTVYLYYVCGSKPSQFTTRQKICDQKNVRCDRLDNLAWESVKGLFADPDRLWDDLKKAQQTELTAQDPKRDELQAVEDFIAQSDREADEIALAMRQAKGRVVESLQKQQDDLNARLEGYHKRRGELIAELGARRLTDDAIQDIIEFARDVRTGIDEADFETKQRIFELLDVKVKVDDDKAQVSCVIANSILCYTFASKFLSESQMTCND
jgi:site-specific DNA recombinase